MKIYFALPLFTPAERRFIDDCAGTSRRQSAKVRDGHGRIGLVRAVGELPQVRVVRALLELTCLSGTPHRETCSQYEAELDYEALLEPRRAG